MHLAVYAEIFFLNAAMCDTELTITYLTTECVRINIVIIVDPH